MSTTMVCSEEQADLPGDLLNALEQVEQRPARWIPEVRPTFTRHTWEQANCVQAPTREFFGDDDQPGSHADLRNGRQWCATCPLQRQCMSYAMRYEPWGLWALTEQERDALGGVSWRSRATKTRPLAAALRAVDSGVDPYLLADVIREISAENRAQRAGDPASAQAVA